MTPSNELVQQMRAAAEKATKVAPAEWGIDTERQDGAPGRYDEFAMFDNLGRRMFGTENSDANFGEIRDDFDEDGGSAWNEPSRLVMKHVEAAQPDNVLALIAALEAANARADAAEAKVGRLTEALKDAIDGYEQYAIPYPHANHQDEKDVARLRAALASEAS